jgi:hypothetical protein
MIKPTVRSRRRYKKIEEEEKEEEKEEEQSRSPAERRPASPGKEENILPS